jgi:4-diphosphocytidyl-2-C-methyl-D-erythritol kinase
MGAGLGGGSSDGANMLLLLNEYFDLSLSTEALLELALMLGSDCPFFILNSPQHATGRGEVMHQAEVDLSAYHLWIACPGIHVSTRDAFAGVSPGAWLPPDPELFGDIHLWRESLHNQFEDSVFVAYPILAKIKQLLYEAGAIYASMTGSGSALYGVAPKALKPDLKSVMPAGTLVFMEEAYSLW